MLWPLSWLREWNLWRAFRDCVPEVQVQGWCLACLCGVLLGDTGTARTVDVGWCLKVCLCGEFLTWELPGLRVKGWCLAVCWKLALVAGTVEMVLRCLLGRCLGCWECWDGVWLLVGYMWKFLNFVTKKLYIFLQIGTCVPKIGHTEIISTVCTQKHVNFGRFLYIF